MSHAQEMLEYLRTIRCGACGNNTWRAANNQWTCECGHVMTEFDVNPRKTGK